MKNFLWACRFLKKRLWLYLLGFGIMLLDSYGNVISTWVQKDIIDQVFIGGNFEDFPKLLILFVLAACIPAFTFIGSAMVCHLVGYNMRIDLGRALLHRIFKIPMKQFQHERTGKFVDMYNNDVERICEDIAYQGLPRVVQWGTGALFTAMAIFMVSPAALLAAAGFAIVYIALVLYFAKKTKDTAGVTRKKSAILTVNMEESVASTREVIAFHRQKWEEKIFNVLFKDYFDAVMNEGKVINQSLLASSPVKWLAIISVLFIGGSGVIAGKITIGGFVILYQYTDQLINYMHNTYDRIVRMGVVSAGVNNLKTVFDDAVESFGNETLTEPVSSIELENVSFKYGSDSVNVLQNLSLSIPAGKKIAVVGGCGCGKSTIAKLLIRFLIPDNGSVKVNGKDVQEYQYDSYSHKVAIVFQEPYMFPDTVLENVTFGNKSLSLDKIRRVCKDVCIDDVIQSLSQKYETQIGDRGTILSGGQRQRLAIARGILKETDVLILDEATSSLDVDTERELQHNLDKLRKGKTTIIIAHRLSTIINSDLIFVMENGRVVESGKHEELMKKNGVYKNLQMQTEAV